MSSEELSETPLRPEHRAFITNYLTNGNNGTQAFKAVRPNVKTTSAATSAFHLLRSPKIQSHMAAIAEEIGLGDRFRLEQLRFALCESVVSEQVRYNAAGEVVDRMSFKRSPTPAERARVVDVINKSTGLYELNRAAGNALSSQFRELARRYAPKLKRTTGLQADQASAVHAETSTDQSIEADDLMLGITIGSCVVLSEISAWLPERPGRNGEGD